METHPLKVIDITELLSASFSSGTKRKICNDFTGSQTMRKQTSAFDVDVEDNGLESEMVIYPPPLSPQTETQSISFDHTDFQRSDIPNSSLLVGTMLSPIADVHSSTPLEQCQVLLLMCIVLRPLNNVKSSNVKSYC